MKSFYSKGTVLAPTKNKKHLITEMFFVLNTWFWRLATFPIKSIIATTVLNCRVRNENGCFHCVKSPEPNI